jgi:hypothetical protein
MTRVRDGVNESEPATVTVARGRDAATGAGVP